MGSFDIQLERNLKGIELEKLNEIDQAIELYEKNVEENFETTTQKSTSLALSYLRGNAISFFSFKS